MIGLGGKQNLPKTPYEPYKCCPAAEKKSTKIAKVTATKDNKKSKGSDQKFQVPEPTKKVISSTVQSKQSKPPQQTKSSLVPDKPMKGKKGLFGSGKYIWWW